MSKKIDLEQIFKDKFEKWDCFLDYDTAGLYCITSAMEEAVRQALALAADNAEVDYEGGVAGVDKNSISIIINDIKR